MVKSCCAYGCTQKAVKGGISFHSFPKSPELRKKWVIATKREKFTPTESTRICGKHFQETDYIQQFGRRCLKEDTVPSLFNFPPHLQKPANKKRKARPENLDTEDHSVKIKSNGPDAPSTSTTATDEELNLNLNVLELATNPPEKSKPVRNPRQPIYFGDFKPEKLKTVEARKVWDVASKQNKSYQKKLKILRVKQKRQQAKIKSLQDLLIHLKEKKKISGDCFSLLEECISPAQKQLLLSQLRVTTANKYPEELRTFALTLHFYSSSAYSYIRKMFNKCLPHPKTLGKWYQSVDGSPGYTKESLRAIEIKLNELVKEGKTLICSLIMDEMHIRTHVQWTGTRQVGYINFGTNMESDSLPEATEVLAFLLVAVNSRWKIPVGYFLTNGLKAVEKATLVKGCLSTLKDLNLTIISLTFDGAASNLSMANVLGANLSDCNNLKTYFPHPDTKLPVYIMLDPCHMIKLIRNALGDWGGFYDGDGQMISWEYFKLLVKLQEQEGLHAATKIRHRHIDYKNEKMKVKLAVQTLSQSVADALIYITQNFKLQPFQGSEATAKFCSKVDNLFDILNTRNWLSKKVYLRPIAKENFEFFDNYFDEMRQYILGLKCGTGQPLVLSRRKTGFLGLLVCMSSIKGIIEDHIIKTDHLRYLLTYKLSQDHIEMFFSNIRQRGGFNNNPTALQFEAAYKKLLVHVELQSSEAANCLAQDETSILKVGSYKKLSAELDLLSSGLEDDYEIKDVPYCLSGYGSDVVEYIAGFVCRKLIRSFNCNICSSALTQTNSFSGLLNKKNRGGLTKPAKEVVDICKVAETIFRGQPEGFFKQNSNIVAKLIIMGVRTVNSQHSTIFPSLAEHILDLRPSPIK